MPNVLVHGFEEAWTSTDSNKLITEVTSFSVSGRASLRLDAARNASGVAAEYVPVLPLDLTAYDELRFWVHADRIADGAPDRPFFLELCYTQGSTERRWLIPVNDAGMWEHHRIGLTGARNAVTRFRLRCVADVPFRLYVHELLAVAEEPLFDVESELTRLLGTDNAPVVVEEFPLVPPAADLESPVLLLALADQREDLARVWDVPQRDSFRQTGGGVVYSVRPPARPVLLEYQILAAARDRRTSLRVRQAVMRRVSAETGLRVNGVLLPVWAMPAIPLDVRDRAIVAPFYLRVHTSVETGERREVPLVRLGELRVAHRNAPEDSEEVDPWR